jgi:lipoprotein-anchoring transpeptidase ErfK/SrfK
LKVGLGAAVVAAGATGVGLAFAGGASKPPVHVPVASGQGPSPATASPGLSTTTTIDTVPAGSPIALPTAGLGIGSTGPAVQAVKQRLTDLRYDPGPINGRFDQQTSYAVVAFQKVHGMSRTGRVTQPVADAMVTDNLPASLISGGEPTRVEVDLSRQVLFFWIDGRLARILPVSSGFGGHYCGDDGSCGIAITPIGAYRATSKILGWHKSPLGELWNPVFFNQGIAIHGEPSVPSVPASHGCVRIPMGDSVWLYNTLGLGTPVYVADAGHLPLPFNRGGSVGPVQPGGSPPAARRGEILRPATPAAPATAATAATAGTPAGTAGTRPPGPTLKPPAPPPAAPAPPPATQPAPPTSRTPPPPPTTPAPPSTVKH